MIDRKEVIKGLEEAKIVIERHVPVRYYTYAKQACSDAIELLKAQEYIDNFNAAIKVTQNVTEELEGVEM